MPDIIDRVELIAGGHIYGGWKRMSITRGIEQIAGTFELEVTERWPGQAASRPIRPGTACQVTLGGTPVITGYVDDAAPDYDAESHSLRVSGRDKTGDLVDCSATHKTGAWTNVTLAQIARDLCAPFGIKVTDTVGGAAFSSFAIQEGETAFECLDRAARMRAVLLVADANGDLVIARAGIVRSAAALEEGKNIQRASGQFSWKERHSVYTIKGQGKLGPDGEASDTLRAPGASARDAVITRHRPLVTLAESHEFAGSLKDRAQWECNSRRGRGSRATITVQGWRDDSGALWSPNTIVRVKSPSLWCDDDLLIASCNYTLDDSEGTRTQLSLALPEAFDRTGIKVRRAQRSKGDQSFFI